MAQVDTSIYNALLQRPKSVAEYDAEAMQGQQNKLALAMSQAKMTDYQQAKADEQAMRGVVSKFGADKTANYNALLGAGRLTEAQAYQKTNADLDETAAKTAKQNADTQETMIKAVNLKMGQARDMFTTIQTPDQAVQLIRGMYADPDLGKLFAMKGDTVDAAVLRIPTEPKAFAEWVQAASLNAEKLATYRTPDANAKLQAKTSTENNAATIAARAAQAAAERAQSDRQFNARENRERQTPRGQIVQTDDGLMLVDPRSGKSQPVTGPTGAPMQPKLKQVPATVSKALLENKASLRTVNKAIAALDAYPDAFGAKNYLGDEIRQRTDPKGITARAYTADIGSLKIHDRSGAAVTAAETPRLKPFIPAATDNPATVRKKLMRFKEEYEAIQADLGETYSREQGYRAGGGAAAATGVDALLEKYGD